MRSVLCSWQCRCGIHATVLRTVSVRPLTQNTAHCALPPTTSHPATRTQQRQIQQFSFKTPSPQLEGQHFILQPPSSPHFTCAFSWHASQQQMFAHLQFCSLKSFTPHKTTRVTNIMQTVEARFQCKFIPLTAASYCHSLSHTVTPHASHPATPHIQPPPFPGVS